MDLKLLYDIEPIPDNAKVFKKLILNSHGIRGKSYYYYSFKGTQQ